MKILVTGGAGFIGSHMIDFLLKASHNVVCVDDLSLGRKEFIEHHIGKDEFTFVKLDLLEKKKLSDVFTDHQFDCVFHFAANSDIQKGAEFLNIDLDKTFLTTFMVLECMKDHGVKQIVFSSSSAIYGELGGLLKEDTGPLFPISYYGAAKLSSEAYISAFVANCDMNAWIIRFPNVIGERTTHGVIHDFILKLREDNKKLIILGDGKQQKPYVYVKDLVEGIVFAWENSSESINYFNLGVDSSTTPTRIAKIIVEEMDLQDVEFSYTGGDRGWVGDIPSFAYDLSKIHALGWKAARTSEDAVRLAVKSILNAEK